MNKDIFNVYSDAISDATSYTKMAGPIQDSMRRKDPLMTTLKTTFFQQGHAAAAQNPAMTVDDLLAVDSCTGLFTDLSDNSILIQITTKN